MKKNQMYMQHGIIFIIVTTAVFLSANAFSSTVDETVESVEKTFAGIHDIKGTFSQTSYIKDIEETRKFAGRFFIKKPSRMMWEYKAPRDEKVVINDTMTWIYKKSENQVIRTKFSKDAYGQVPIALLTSFEDMRGDFDITMPEKNALNLVPKKKIGSLKMLVLELSGESFPVKMFTIIDVYGNMIMIEITDVEINSGLDDALFKFEIPSGAEVFDMNR